jgi:ankyrin repeat protein
MRTSTDTAIPKSFTCPISHLIFFDPVVDEEGNTFEREAIVEHLKQGGTSPLTRNKLSIAALRINRTVKNIIEEWLGQNPDKWSDVYKSETLLASLFEAIREKLSLTIIRGILDKDPRLLTRKKDSGYTAWHYACHAEFGSSFIVEKFLEILKEEKNQHHLTRLLEMNNPTGFKPKHAKCALRLALNKGDIDSATSLFNLVKLGATDITQLDEEDGTTLFHRVVMLENPKPESILWLLEKMQFKHDNQEDYSNEKLSMLQPLHLAVVLGDLTLLNALLAKNIYINFQDNYGNTALHIAAKHGRDSVIPHLIRAGANHKLKNNERLTPSKVAEQEKHFPSSDLIAKTVHEINFQARQMLCLYHTYNVTQSYTQNESNNSPELNSATSTPSTASYITPGGF